VVAILIAAQMFARVTRQADTGVLVSIDGRLAELAKERAITAVRQALRLIVFLWRAVIATVLALIDAH